MLVLELYSGIGGMHLALSESQIDGKVVASVDINTVANSVYKHNFPNTLLLNKNIQSLEAKYINKLGADTILMSPPCQPFTRNGLKGDVNDARTCSFAYLLSILNELEVKNILMENVKGFETSQMRNMFIDTLEKCNFTYQEFILSPTQFGVPNTRHRYYCLAKKKPAEFKFKNGPLMTSLPFPYCEDAENLSSISNILEESIDKDFYLSDDVLKKRVKLLDICYKDSRRSCCFTKAYKRYAEGTGSVFTDRTETEVDLAFKDIDKLELGDDKYLEKLRMLNLRYFTPREVCRLMCFPEYFDFPNIVSNKQRYMLLGNSINVKVVAELIKVLND